MPRQIPFIIGSEGCERFSFYGMRNILTPFLITSLLLFMPDEVARKAHAKEVFHTFVIGVYFFPLLGGWIADRFFGKFNTILWFSLIYCAGHALLAIFENDVNGFFAGLFLIALGAGGIKPLVASFVGDQFDDRNKHLAKLVFDAFYWIINFGSFFASLLMPVFLASWGPRIAFGIPGALMFIATLVLWLGKRMYVMVPVEPSPPGSAAKTLGIALSAIALGMPILFYHSKMWLNTLVPVGVFVVGVALTMAGRKVAAERPRSSARQHSFGSVVRTALTTHDKTRGDLGKWIAVLGVIFAYATFALYPLKVFEIVPVICIAMVVLIAFGGIGTAIQLERARGVHPDEAVDGVRAVLRVLIVFALVTPFHSLFDQKASTWVLQGGDMAKPIWDISENWYIDFQPAQMQAFNPALVMLLIPFNNLVLYPWLRRRGWEPTALRRMTFGILFSGIAWIAAGVLQLAIDGAPKDSISIFWQILPYVLLTFGEVLVSATGLEFAYSQAPLSMKGVIMSFWNLTTTIGNLWVLLVDAGIRRKGVTEAIKETGLSNTAFLMFFFAVFAFVATLAFYLYTRRYRPTDNYRSSGGASPGPQGNLPVATAREK
jgi:POT family proton-dependent oligopeptide transporter